LPLAAGQGTITRSDASAAAPQGEEAGMPTPPQLATLDERAVETVTACDPDGWCWEPTVAPGEPFEALSRDGRFAIGRFGVVFETPNKYHPRFTDQDLLAIETTPEAVWVGGYAGLWSYDGASWTQRSADQVAALSATPGGQLWGIRNNTVARWEDDDWVEMSLPTVDLVQDIVALEENKIWVLTQSLFGREGGPVSLLEWADDAWQENASGLDLNYTARFLRGDGTAYVAGLTTFEEPRTLKVLDPGQEWASLANAPAVAPELAFWGPGGQLWGSASDGVFAFADPSRKITAEPCIAAVTWDATTIQCRKYNGGLSYISLDGADAYSVLPDANPAPLYLPETFGTVPTAVFAAADVAWGTSGSDVWRAPLEHYDGTTWTDWRDVGDEFSAIEIDGTASDNVWFASQLELRRWNGASIESMLTGSDVPVEYVESVRTFGPNDTWVLVSMSADPTELRHFDGETWTTPYTLTKNAHTLLGSGPDDLWTIALDAVSHFDGSNWTQVAAPPADVLFFGGTYDNGELWLSSGASVYQLQGTVWANRGNEYELGHLALTPGRVWSYGGGRVRSRPR